MKHKGCLLMTVFTLYLGFVAPVWATHTNDPLEESYSQHVLPYYNGGAGFLSFAVFADTSFRDPLKVTSSTASLGVANVHLYFFNKTCALVRDLGVVPLTANGVVVLQLDDFRLPGIPNEGVIFADTGHFSDGDNERFLAYMILVNLADNTTTRIDSIPFSPLPPIFPGLPPGGHWTRYDPVNTIAVTIGDSTLTAVGEIRTTLTFFNAVGGFGNQSALVAGARDTLREFLSFYGFPYVGDWVTTGTSTTSQVTPGMIQLDAYNGDGAPEGSRQIPLNCFERVRLSSLFPLLATPQPPAPRLFFGHVVAFSLADAGRTTNCPPNGQCGFSGFQETVVEGGAADLIFSGYFHHSQ